MLCFESFKTSDPAVNIPQTVNHSSSSLQNYTSWLQAQSEQRVASASKNSTVIHLFDLAKHFNRYKHGLKVNAGILPCFATSHPFSSPQPLFLLLQKVSTLKANRFTQITILCVSQTVFMVLQSIACALGTHHFGNKEGFDQRAKGCSEQQHLSLGLLWKLVSMYNKRSNTLLCNCYPTPTMSDYKWKELLIHLVIFCHRCPMTKH